MITCIYFIKENKNIIIIFIIINNIKNSIYNIFTCYS